jgi:alpha,alpha-trehalase
LLAGDGANSTAAFAFFSSVNMVMNKYNGTFPTTFIDTGLQWYVPSLCLFALPLLLHRRLSKLIILRSVFFFADRDAPNAWPPHQYIVIAALRALPSNVTGGGIPSASANSSFSLIPAGQLGIDESQLPGQPIRFSSDNSTGTFLPIL